MQSDHLIPANSFCIHHNIELSFISSLHENGLIEVFSIEETLFIDARQLGAVEKFVRLHYDMGINIEGMEAIAHLLQRVNALQENVQMLKNKLRLYELE